MAVAADYNVIPVTETFIADTETPVSAFLKLRGSGPAFLLESAEQGQRVGRYSFIGVEPRKVVRWSLADGGDPYAIAAAEVAEHRQAPLADGPPFTGGAVGFFGYDCVRAVEPLGEPNPDVLGLPDMALMLSDVLVAFDHLKHTVTILANAYRDEPDGRGGAPASGSPRCASAWPARCRAPSRTRSAPSRSSSPTCRARRSRRWWPGSSSTCTPATPSRSCRASAGARRARSSRSRSTAACARSTRRPTCTSSTSRTSRSSAPRPSRSSPSPAARASTRPIAGTRPRGADADADIAIAADLLADEKERAEHVMLVDLGRNDLGRVCEYGTVEVETFMAVETYSHVIHIVSSVRGELRPEVKAIDALRSVLPAGTLSGAPKVRAMQIIDELEPVKRGAYGGAVGWLSYAGDLDTCICIRTVVIKDGVAHVQAGGGTVADAKPDYEYEESRAKARGVVRAIELAAGQREWP